MTSPCPICGGRMNIETVTNISICPYCHFEHHASKSKIVNSNDFILPYAQDVNAFFRTSYMSLKKGELLYITCPTKGKFIQAETLEGQVNFFRPKNIMFLLEKHGFRLVSRSPRWKDILKISAQKM